MNFIKNNAGVIAVVALIIAVIGVYTPAGQSVIKSFGGVSNYDEIDTTALKVGGANGSRVGPIITGTCNLSTSATSIVATSSALHQCAVTGVASGDTVFVTLNYGRALTTFGGILVTDAQATTTGVIGVTLLNLSGIATSSYPLATTSVQYVIFHAVSTVPGL